jgi:glyoxylase-like metal-dependent hydrolase (beta-lactamase superfamily II)
MDISKIRSNVDQITPERLRKILDGEEDWFLLDVRNDIEFERWKLEGKNTPETVNIPYFEFFDREDEIIKQIPRGKPVLAVCAKGDSSAYVADLLNQRGFKALNLRGGTATWGDFYDVREIPGYNNADKGGLFLQINRVGKGCLSYMLISEGSAVVIDAGRHIQTYLDLAEKHDASITTILDTHLHADHISGGPDLAIATGADYFIQSADTEDAPLRHKPLQDTQIIHVGKSRIEVIALFLPGHTPGSTTYLVDDKFLLTGDTLFVDGVGRPDLGGMVVEWAHMLYDSLFRKLDAYSDDLVVLPTHYTNSSEIDHLGLVMGTLGNLRKSNPALQIRGEDEFVSYIQEQIKSQPAIYADIRLVNLKKKAVDEDEASEMELGKNECAAAPH